MSTTVDTTETEHKRARVEPENNPVAATEKPDSSKEPHVNGGAGVEEKKETAEEKEPTEDIAKEEGADEPEKKKEGTDEPETATKPVVVETETVEAPEEGTEPLPTETGSGE